MDPYFFIYRASAGSGKTYTLVREYLLLALQNPSRGYRHILAITFTNKAMQEMKSRIVYYLADFVQGKPHPMAADLQQELKIDEKAFRERSKILLDRILHDYSYFAISTIDAFFQRIIRSFTRELKLNAQYQLELDSDLIKMKAVDDLIADLKEGEHKTRWVQQFAEEQSDDGSSWDIRGPLNKFSGEIFKESFEEYKETLPDKQQIIDLKRKLDKVISDFKEELLSFSDKADSILRAHNLTIDDFSHKSASVYSLFNKFRFEAPEKIKIGVGTRIEKGCHEVSQWLNKEKMKDTRLTTIVSDELMPLLNEAVEFYNDNLPEYLSAYEASKNIYSLGLLADINQKIQEYKEENNVQLIQDATLLIRQLMKNSDSAFIFEKAGSFFQHYLIDEFQDTSMVQWACLRPLVYDAISSGNKSMVVGDAKQSIYRWRGGDWNLLQNKIEEDVLPQPSKYVPLNTNFRSGELIINFNNRLFNNFPPHFFKDVIPADALKHSTIDLFNRISKVYDDAEQVVDEKNLNKGYINIQFLTDDDNGYKGEALKNITDKIDDVLSRGFSLRDICMLVRKKNDASMLARHLLSKSNDDGTLKYPVLTNEALLLKNSSVITLIISTLKYLHDQSDKVALAEMNFHYAKISIHGDNFNEILSDTSLTSSSTIPFDLEVEKFRLTHLPLEELVEELIRQFGLPGNSGEEAYLQTFQDHVLDFGRSEGNDIYSFLEWWEEKGVSKSINIPSGIDAINIMTIHKVKGLQFPVVMVPFLNWEVDTTWKSIIWGTAEEMLYKNHFFPFRYVKNLARSYFKNSFYEEKIQARLDSLNTLYVAFTRAENELYAIGCDNGKIDNIGGCLLKFMEDENSNFNEWWTPQTSTLEYGEKFTNVGPAKNDTDQVHLEKYHSTDWRKKLVIKKIGSDEINEQATRGSRMHYLLSKIKKTGDIETSSYIKSISDDALIEDLRNIITHPDISKYYSHEYEVLNEQSILIGEDLLRPDRVVIKDNEAVVIDYKWGTQNNKYKAQVQEYTNALKNMGFKKAHGYLYYVDQKIVEEVS